MSNSGALLRKKKQENTRYTFTRAELEARDYRLIEENRMKIEAKLREDMEKAYKEKEKLLNEAIDKEWESRAKEFGTGDREEDFFQLLTYFLAISSRVLIEKFGWTPPNRRNAKILRFGDCLIDEIDKISGDALLDIRRYNEETYKLYGIKFTRKEEE